MENRKLSPLKICNLFILLLGFAVRIYIIVTSFKTPGMNDIPFSLLASISELICLVFGFIYLLEGYKKNAAVYYKGFMWSLVISELFCTASPIYVGLPNIIKALAIAIRLILVVILAVGKDLGKTNTYVIVIALILANCYLAIDVFGPAQAGDKFSMAILLDNITQLIFTVTTALMIIAKYKDKESRGAK